jgi:hypothetical protein
MRQDQKSLVILSIFVLTAAAIGFVGTAMLMNAKAGSNAASPPTKDLLEARASFEANLKRLDALHTQILTQFQNTSSYPISATMQSVSVALGKDTNPAAVGKYGGVYVYWSETGKDYKLIAQTTGDCHIARERRPEMIDIGRSWGPVDCIGYGYWSPGGKSK